METTQERSVRYLEIDIARGIAILMMVLFHILYDLSFFGIADVGVHSGFWRGFGYLTAILFVFIAGISLSLSYARSSRVLSEKDLTVKYVLRGLRILGLGIIITIVTWLYLNNGFIIFGILHLIGLSIIISPVFFGYKRLNLVGGIIIIIAGWFVTFINGPLWLAWLGLHPESFYSIDYEPLLPWLGVVLIGVFTGKTLYPDGTRSFHLPPMRNPVIGGLTFLGRHSLIIYMLHQPVIILLIAGITGISIF